MWLNFNKLGNSIFKELVIQISPSLYMLLYKQMRKHVILIFPFINELIKGLYYRFPKQERKKKKRFLIHINQIDSLNQKNSQPDKKNI